MSAGWLSNTPPADTHIGAFPIDRAKFPTRHAEYQFVLDHLPSHAGALLDSGAGFDPTIHILPQALEAKGWHVIAVDANPECLKIPGEHVVRWVDDIRHLWRWQGGAFDVWLCISTLEHLLNEEERLRTVQAGVGCLRPGGRALLTADFIPPQRLLGYLRYAGCSVGAIDLTPGTLTPPVSWAIGQKP